MAARYHGRYARCYLSPGTGAAVPLKSISGWSFDNTKDRADTTSFEDTVKTSVLGFGNGQITMSGYYDTDDSTVFSAADAAGGAVFYGYPSINAPSKYIAAPVFVDYSLPDINVNSAVPLRVNVAVKGDMYINL